MVEQIAVDLISQFAWKGKICPCCLHDGIVVVVTFINTELTHLEGSSLGAFGHYDNGSVVSAMKVKGSSGRGFCSYYEVKRRV